MSLIDQPHVKLVRPQGVAPARVMIVGDFPTEAEFNLGFSFPDTSMTFMKTLMMHAGIVPEQCWRTHYYKTKISGWVGADAKTREKTVRELQKQTFWDDFIRAEIEQIKPNIIVAMGELALRGLTGQSGVFKRAGSYYPLKQKLAMPFPTRVLASLSMRDVYADYKQVTIVQNDLARIRPWVNRMAPIEDDFKLYIGKSPKYIKDWIKHFKKGAKFGVTDVETHKNFITCLCFCYDGNNSLSIPLFDPSYDQTTRGFIWHIVYYELCSGIGWANQNIKYDWNRLEAQGFRLTNIIGDTMLRSSILHPELPKGLDFLTRLYTNVGYYKDEGKEFDPKIHDYERMLLYNAKDGIATHRVFTRQAEELEARGLTKVNSKLQTAFFIYKEMDDTGIRIDDDARLKLIGFYDRTISLFEAELFVISGKKINVNSSDQVGQFLIDYGAPTKIQVWNDEKQKMSYKTGRIELEDVYVNVSDMDRLAHVVKLILDTRKLYKLRQFCRLVTQVDPRTLDKVIRTSFKLHGTETGRSATGELLESIYFLLHGKKTPEWTQPGMSFQQIPKHPWVHDGVWYGEELRRMFVPRRGKIFIEFDKSQAEARVVDVLAENYDSLEEYGRIDKHCKTACIIFGGSYEEMAAAVKAKDIDAKIKRQKGKTYKHGFNYDENAFSISHRAHVPLSEAQMALKKLKEADPKIENIFQATIKKAIATTRELETPYGRKRVFHGQMSNKMLKEAYADIPQSVIPDHMRFDIMIPLRAEIGHSAWASFLIEWHDSLFAEVTIGREEEYCEKANRLSQTPILFKTGTFIRNYELVIPSEFSIGENWLEMKPYVI